MDGLRFSKVRWAITVVLVLATSTAFPEAPDWVDLTGHLIMTRHHWWEETDGEVYHGLWDFDPEAGALRRLRPLTLTGPIAQLLGGSTGDGHYLASVDATLVVQTWPHFLEFEAPSWRVLRRYPPAASFGPIGWATQGPMLSEEAAAAVGLEPGLYGFPGCVLEIITRGGSTPERACEPFQFPGWIEPHTRGDGSAMLRRGLDPPEDDLTFVTATNPYNYHPLPGFIPPSLTFDRENGGFWRAGTRTIEFMPVIDGVVQPASIVEEPSVAPPDLENWRLFALHHHPTSGRLFGTSGDPWGDSYIDSNEGDLLFFSLDRDLSLLETYDILAGSATVGWPISITSLSAQPTTHQQTIPVASHTAGRLGTFWSSDLWFFNPSGEPITVHVRRVAAPFEKRAVEVPAHGSILDQVHTLGNDASFLTLDRRTPGRFRHNLGVVNDSGETVTLTLVWGWMEREPWELRPLRPVEGVQEVTAPPHSVAIINLEELFPDEAEDDWPPRIAVFGDRPVLLWLSMVDNSTGDATFVPYTNFRLRTGWEGDRSVLPVVASTEGKAGTRWMTDAYGFERNTGSDKPVAFFHPQRRDGQCGGAALQGEIRGLLDGEIGMPLDDWVETMRATGAPPASEEYPASGWRTIFPDIIHLFPECEGEEDIKGGLEIVAGSWTSGYSRTYTTRDDGGTYGGMLPLYPPNGWPVQHFAGIEVGSGFRMNVGLFNGDHDHTITHRLTLYSADGTEVASVEIDLAPLELRQQSLAHILGLPAGSIEEGTYGLTVIPLDDDETGIQGRSWAFVSLVDNTTGDPTNWW